MVIKGWVLFIYTEMVTFGYTTDKNIFIFYFLIPLNVNYLYIH